MPTNKPLRTPAQVRAAFLAQGITITAWAQENGFKVETVKGLLLGRVKGNFGEGHRAAIALGLKRADAEETLGRRASN